MQVNEHSRLVQLSVPTVAENSRENIPFTFSEGMNIVKSFFDGMAKTYSTVGLIAVYTVPGLWLLGPVIAGGTLSLSAQILVSVEKRYSSDPLIKDSSRISLLSQQVLLGYLNMAKFANLALVGFLEDLGFTWSMFTAIAVQVGGVAYNDNTFSRVIAPLISLVPAGLIRHARYKHANNKNDNAVIEVFASTFRAASSSTFITALLQDQEVLSQRSVIPSMLILATGIAGFFSGLFKNLKNPNPKISFIINSVIEVMFENPSLAAAFFAFPNDIYAALDHDEISEGFFYSNAGVSACYFMMLTVATMLLAVKEWNTLEEENKISASKGGDKSHSRRANASSPLGLETPLQNPSDLPRARDSKEREPSPQTAVINIHEGAYEIV